MIVVRGLSGVTCVTKDQFRVLEEISGPRGSSTANSKDSKADDLIAAAISAFAGVMRPSRQNAQQLVDLVLPLLASATTRGKRQAANALAALETAARPLLLALANEPAEISAPLLLRSPRLRPTDLIDIINKNGVEHARAISRRQSADPELRQILRSFHDPMIERMLQLQENLANLETEQSEQPQFLANIQNQPGKNFTGALSEQEQRGFSLHYPLIGASAAIAADHLVNTALLVDDQIFRTALADALDLTFERADKIIGEWPNSYLPIALRALGLSASECYLIMTSILGRIDADRENLREFVHIYRSIDREKAIALIRRWKADDMSRLLRNKLREMAQAQDQSASGELNLAEEANSNSL